MSSILKALKKIEEDSPPFQPHQTLLGSTASMPVFKSNAGRRRRKMFFLFMVLLAMVIATVMVYSQRVLIIAKIGSMVASYAPATGKKPDTDRNRVYRAKISRAPAKPTSKPPSVSRRSKTQPIKAAPGSKNTSRQVGPKSGQQRTVGTPPPSRKSPVDRKPAQAGNARLPRPRKKGLPVPSSKPAPRTTAAKVTRSPATATGAPKPVRSRSSENYDRITGSNLKLQALAWSEEADRRMAVINGSIVHEGESVDGYQVLKIRAEDVVVRKGGKSWRLEFGLQQ
ncbi:hypothetical protein JY97_09380 [Alkalispirochaeta odontotermitis]|nr:hypothetical protein JY97_09380 [Alkalispirochaeta odontotermitis]CAB1069300.1 hypothetical protein D1AOALGA4SA_647 [Olavius algarvensis Delta 1 endosymbiont]